MRKVEDNQCVAIPDEYIAVLPWDGLQIYLVNPAPPCPRSHYVPLQGTWPEGLTFAQGIEQLVSSKVSLRPSSYQMLSPEPLYCFDNDMPEDRICSGQPVLKRISVGMIRIDRGLSVNRRFIQGLYPCSSVDEVLKVIGRLRSVRPQKWSGIVLALQEAVTAAHIDWDIPDQVLVDAVHIAHPVRDSEPVQLLVA